MNIEHASWVLNPDVLMNLALDMEKNGRLLAIQRDDNVKEFTIPLRSALSKNVYYELQIKRGPMNGVIRIYLCSTDSEVRSKVYENGRIVRWGFWALELMETLPSEIAEEAKQASVESEYPAEEEVAFNMINEELCNAAGVSTLDHRLWDRGGMPISLLK